MSDHGVLVVVGAVGASIQTVGLIVLALQLKEARREVRESLREVRRDSRRMVRALAQVRCG